MSANTTRKTNQFPTFYQMSNESFTRICITAFLNNITKLIVYTSLDLINTSPFFNFSTIGILIVAKQ